MSQNMAVVTYVQFFAALLSLSAAEVLQGVAGLVGESTTVDYGDTAMTCAGYSLNAPQFSLGIVAAMSLLSCMQRCKFNLQCKTIDYKEARCRLFSVGDIASYMVADSASTIVQFGKVLCPDAGATVEEAAASLACQFASHFPPVECRPGTTNSTVFHHNAEGRTFVKGFEARGSYKKEVEYTHDMEVITSVISYSLRCEQFWKYESKGSKLARAFWVSRDGSQVEKFPSGTGDNPCYCSGTEPCCCSGDCNADIADAVDSTTWVEDEGFLTNMGLLPVKELRFGDTGEWWEEGYHTLGPLVCYI